ncbi:MAG: hypothetical protein IKW11_02865 [Bacteroidales bacterium]|nr:hypothetical protein [Bacteroidales bacterium]
MYLRYTLLTCLLFVGLSMGAQQKKTEKTTITNPSGVGAELPCTLEYDYTIVDSTKVANGSFKISGKNDSKDLKESYTLKAQASNGQLNGPLTADYSLEGVVNGAKRYLVFSYSGAFQDGLPHGDTKIKSFGQGSSAYDVKMSFNKGVLQGKFKFNAFIKKEIDIEGSFNSDGQMTGSWKFGRYDILAEKAERNNLVLSNGLKISGDGYTKELEAEAQKFSEGKITEEDLKKKGIIVNISNGDGLKEFILEAIRNRFIPFDSMPAIDLSKVCLTYKYLSYFPAVNNEGFQMLLTEIDRYDGYTLPKFATFGIITNEEGEADHKFYNKEFEKYILNSMWNEDDKCEVLFTDDQANELGKRLEATQEKWKKGAIAICRSNYEILIGQQLLGKSSAEISTLMKNAIKRGYKVEADYSAKRYESYSPIVGFESGVLTPSNDSTALHKFTGIVNIEHKDSIGYKTYEWTIFVTNTDPTYICDDLNNSFTPQNFRRVRNDYDTINELISVIKKNNTDFETISKNALDNPFANYSEHIHKITEIDHSDLTGTIEQLTLVIQFQQEFKEWLVKSAEIKNADSQIKDTKNKFGQIKDSYEEYLKGTNLTWSPDNNLEELIKLEDVQKDILFFIEGSSRLAENHKKIRTNGSKYKEMLNEYKKFIKHTDLNWSIGTDLKQLDSILNIQNKTLEFIGKRDQIALNHTSIIDACEDKYPKVEKAYNKYYRKADFSWSPDVCQEKLDSIISTQNNTIQFISLRDTIVDNHHIILKESRIYRHIRNAYEAYIDNADVSWTQEVNLAKLEEIITLQDACKSLLQRSDIKQINKSARKNKMSDLKELLK